MPITKEEISTLPLIHYEGAIELISTKDEWLSAYAEIKNEKILGFDTETKPSFVKGKTNLPAIVQLATAQKVYVIQLYRLRLPIQMRELLSNPDIFKVGVAIKDDMLALQKRGTFKPQGHIDLAHVAHKKGYKESGLRTLCAALLHKRISKNMRCTNWERIHLSEAQIHYAATDAWVSREIYLTLDTIPS